MAVAAIRKKSPVQPRRKRRLLLAGAAFFAALGAGKVALDQAVARLPPLDVAAAVGERSTVVLDREGRLLRAFTTRDGRWRLPVKLAEVDPRYVAMLVAYEDKRFWRHPGIDPLAALRAAWQMAASGRVVSGGSTLTMQVARLLEPREERSLGAKLRQALRAVDLERRFSKKEILSFYLALAPFGGNLEGLRAASFAYFGKEPRRLSQAEAALLVALPQSPETRRPDRAPERAFAARERVLARAQSAGLLNAAEHSAASSEAVASSRRGFPMLAAHAAENAHKQRPQDGEIRLTIDANQQVRLENLLKERVEAIGPKLTGAILVVDNASGEVRAHVGGVDYFAAERAGGVDMAFAVRSPGSALKPFIYAFAFAEGLAHPETILDDRRSRFGGYTPENFDLTYQGTVTARRALQNSLNVPAVELLAELGPQRLVTRLKAAGADLVMPKEAPPGLAIALGGLGIRLADLAKLYVGLARGGETVPLVWRTGEKRKISQQELRLTEPVAAWYVADILRGAPAPTNALSGRIAYKTGTSYGYRDAFAVGFDKRHTIAVWVGRADGSAVPGLVAREVAAPILFDAFSRIGLEPDTAPPPRDALIATTASLPPPLRHIRRDMPKTLAATMSVPLKIAFPPDGARVDLGLARTADADRSALALKATGGVPPFTWLVNGAPVSQEAARRQSAWTPDGAGFARVSIIDATGATDSVSVRLE